MVFITLINYKKEKLKNMGIDNLLSDLIEIAKKNGIDTADGRKEFEQDGLHITVDIRIYKLRNRDQTRIKDAEIPAGLIGNAQQ